MPACPICSTESNTKRESTPYFMCSACGVWWQDPMPSKHWHGPHETWLGQPMPEDEKRINAGLADWLFTDIMGGKPGYTLDIGVSYPWLAYCLKQRGCAVMGIDGDGQINNLGVHVIHDDFETIDPDKIGAKQRLITFVHSFEHVYDPVAVMRKVRGMLAEDGAVYIRMPDNQVEGIERDLTEGHFLIHPFIHALSSIAECCARTEAFVIERAAELKPGQRDLVLRPI